MTAFRVIGKRPRRVDGLEKVTGQAAFGADLRLPGMLYGKVLRSPHPHARVLSIDTTAALEIEGVMGVVTGDDLPAIADSQAADLGETSIDVVYLSKLLLARDKVLFKGHPVAAVAAVSPHIAEEAAARIHVEYEPLPPVTDVLAAMEPDAPLLHDDLYTKTLGDPTQNPSNIAEHILHERGDVAAGLAAADIVVERSFRTDMVHQGYIEPQACVVQVGATGKVTCWTTTQGSFLVRDQLSDIFELPVSKIRVIPMEIGGGFGGKTYIALEALGVALSRKVGRPVKLVMTRAEVFQATGPAPPTTIRLKMGIKRSGELTGAEAFLAYDAGAFPGSPVGAACLSGLSPYRIPHLRIDGYDVVTNKPRVQAYRAPGAPPMAMAVETVVDELAAAIGLDPVQVRLQNASAEGDPMTNGTRFNRIGFKEVLQAVAQHPSWTDPLEGPHRGRGVAAGFWMNGQGSSSCHLAFNDDGTAHLTLGSVDVTGTRTTMAQIAAEELGLAAEDVQVLIGDTDAIGYTDVTGGSRVTYSTGVAVYNACQEAIAEFRNRAAKRLQVSPEEVEYQAGCFALRSDPGTSVTLQDLAGNMTKEGGVVSARGVSSGLKRAPGFGVHVVDVEVDPDTGRVKILRYTAFQDAGKAIHPTYVEGQMQGGAVQGIGWALTEGYTFSEGIMQNPTLLDYRILTALDLPMIDTVIIEVPASDGPYGVRGVGEVPIVPPLGAVANAIYHAVGVRLNHLPMTPERVFFALAAEGAQATPEQQAG